MPSSEVKYDLHMKDIAKKLTMVINLKGVRAWEFKRKLAMIHLRIAAWLLGVGIRLEE